MRPHGVSGCFVDDRYIFSVMEEGELDDASNFLDPAIIGSLVDSGPTLATLGLEAHSHFWHSASTLEES